jgi:hypothetical protein
MHLIHPEHPLSGPQILGSGKSAIRPSGGLLSERRLAYFLSGAPRADRLFADHNRFSHDGTRAAGPGEAGDGRQQMQEKDSKVTHAPDPSNIANSKKCLEI